MPEVNPTRPLRVLTTTTLYPSSVNPRHGIFVQTRLARLREAAPVSVHVVAPVPWFPLRATCFGRYATYAATPRHETREGFEVQHPRYLTIPKFGMALQPYTLAASMLRCARQLMRAGQRFDVIDAHYFYPDGVAAARVAQCLGLPFVITARGSDVNLIARYPGPRKAILQSAQQAQRVIAVSTALKQALIALGVAQEKIEVLRNGVDTQCFAPRPAQALRHALRAGPDPVILSVGNLVPEKGHDLVMRAAARIAGATLVIVGQGPEHKALITLAQQLGVAERTRFLNNMPQPQLSEHYSAADVLALGSQREGWPNVLLEAMACGTPVVATDVGGVREIVASAAAGRVVAERTVDAFAQGLQDLLAVPPDRTQTCAYAASFDWESIALRYYDVLSQAAAS